MRGFPLYGSDPESIEAGMDAQREEAEARATLSSALDKLGLKADLERKRAGLRGRQVSLRLTVEELFALRQFGRKFADD